MPRFDHPHDHDHNHDWSRLEERLRRAFRRVGQQFGPQAQFEHMGDSFRIGRMLAGGDLRLIVLYLIDKQPRHGYDLIKAIEDASHGLYSPSPGVIYPALTYLEEAGFVTSTQEANKKSYSITPEGRAHLDKNRAAIDRVFDFLGKAGERMGEFRASWRQEQRQEQRQERDRDIDGVIPEVNAARRALKQAIAEAVTEGVPTQKRLAEILDRAARDIRNAVNGTVDI